MIKDIQWNKKLHSILTHEKFTTLIEKVKSEYKTHPNKIFPKPNEIFNAFELTPLNSLRIIILGQDPYPTKGHAHGLAFSSLSYNRPRSLANIFSEIYNDIGAPRFPYNELFASNDLSVWAQQGILLLNTCLTVKENEPNSHANIGWEWFTESFIRLMNNNSYPLIYMLWGSKAQLYSQLIDPKHIVVKTSHPSPLSYDKGFKGNKQFSLVSDKIKELHTDKNNPLRIPIEWFVPQNGYEHCYRIKIGDITDWSFCEVTIRALYNEWFYLIFPYGIMSLHLAPAKQAFVFLDKLHTLIEKAEFNKYGSKKELLYAIEDLYKKYDKVKFKEGLVFKVQYNQRHKLT